MDYALNKITWKCNGCGARFEEPDTCPHCQTSLCPECERTGCLQNMIETERSRSLHLQLASQNRPSKKPKKERKIKDPEAEAKRLMELIKS